MKRESLPLVRIGRIADLDALYALAASAGSGLTNLPADRDALLAKLEASEAAIASQEGRDTGAAIILIVALDGIVVGTSCIFARIGAGWPFYSYRLTRQASRSLAMGRTQAQILLNLVNDFDGEAEVGGLFIDSRMRGHALGVLAARARYVFIAAHRSWFGRRVIAELRGWQDAEGHTPVWEAIGRHFYAMDFRDADRTGALTGNQFIADLGPRYPLYVSMLPDAARAALGRPHDDGRPAYDMLVAEGFHAGDYVDIFDGGPTLVADIDSVATVRATQARTVVGVAEVAPVSLIATGSADAFRLTRGGAALEPDGVTLAPNVAEALGVGTGDLVQIFTGSAPSIRAA